MTPNNTDKKNMKPKIRYCVDKCGSHTRGKIKPFYGNDNELDFDVNDFLVCPWCARVEEQLKPDEPDIGMVMTGHDNRRDWVKGEKWRK